MRRLQKFARVAGGLPAPADFEPGGWFAVTDLDLKILLTSDAIILVVENIFYIFPMTHFELQKK